MNLEVECKIALKEVEVAQLRETLKKLTKEQFFLKKDFYYIKENNFGSAIRLRIEDSLLTVTKKDKKQTKDKFEINKEQQIYFDKALFNQIEELLYFVDFQKKFSKEKEGYKYFYNNLIIELVEIKSLGYFIEIESTLESTQDSLKNIKEMLILLNLDNREPEDKYYWQLIEDNNGTKS